MSTPPSNGHGPGPLGLPLDLLPTDERERREKAAIAGIEARLVAGTLSPEQADAEILEIALARFSFLPANVIDELREVGRELNEEPEMVETRALAPHPPGEPWDEDR